ncbi:hypothetical protein JZ751_024704 [Albula glossodonta]|uniref:small monomeric GTPase n=3 Tax=Teleostei TaxID=32443 RepID=A0A8T2PE54_9TELE|nr:hypothetical protein JZ751_024704 [Albula glossodonta]
MLLRCSLEETSGLRARRSICLSRCLAPHRHAPHSSLYVDIGTPVRPPGLLRALIETQSATSHLFKHPGPTGKPALSTCEKSDGGEQQQVPHCGLQESTGAGPQCHALPPVCPLSSQGPSFTRPDISPCTVPSEHAWSRTSAAPLCPRAPHHYSRPRAMLTTQLCPPGERPVIPTPSRHQPSSRASAASSCGMQATKSSPAGERYAIVLQVSLGQGEAQSCCQFLCDAIKHQSSSRTGNRRGVLMGLHLSESLETQGRKGRQNNPSCRLAIMDVSDLFWMLLAILTVLPPSWAQSLVQLNTGIRVSRGKSVFVTEKELQFNILDERDTCKVEVVLNEPVTQRVGKLTPQVFDCYFLPDEVKYIHDGSPLVEEDTVILRIYRFTESKTFLETLLLRVRVVEPQNSLIHLGSLPLEVPEFHGLSNIIDSKVLTFPNRPEVICTVRLLTSETRAPALGQLVRDDPSKIPATKEPSLPNSGPRKGRQTIPCPGNKACVHSTKEVRFLKANCEEFLNSGLKYQHLSPPSPEIDYIPIRVELRDHSSRTLLEARLHYLTTESFWIPVLIHGAMQNQPPHAAFMSMFILEVDQFILTPMTTAALDAKDDETPQDQLVFNMTKPPAEGYITHLDDHTKPTTSFTWQDLYEMKIAYQPPNSSHVGRRTYEVEFQAIDSSFATSDPIMVHFSIRTAKTNAPRVSWNMGLDLLEGQSRPITWENLQIVDNDNIEAVHLVAVDGPLHGRLSVRDGKGFMFKVRDLREGVVVYHHSDSDTTRDYIVFRITDGRHSIRHKFPINILPKDDTPPFLINNVAFEVQEGGSVLVEEYMLLASDLDSSDDYILYQLLTLPRAGEIIKRPSPQQLGVPVKSFLQRDLFQGLIYYRHLGEEVFEDSFDFVLSDSHQPPNLSHRQTVVVHVSPVKDQLPVEVSGSVRSITVKETEIVPLSQAHLNFRDTESPDTDLMYLITQPCFSPTTIGLRDAGRLFYTDSTSSMTKNPTVPVLKSFTQHAVNHLKVGYMPPLEDIGPEPVFVQFIFSVSDQQGGTLSGLVFNITVTPVDNQLPELFTNALRVEEGGGGFVTEEHLLVRDPDTQEAQLRVRLHMAPQHGRLELQGLVLREGDTFTLQDLRALRLRYIHDDSETLEDTIGLTATDGVNSAHGGLSVQILPVNDEPPLLGAGLRKELTCEEGGRVQVTAEYLFATDADSDDARLTYMLARGEIGPNPVLDTVTLIVSDGEAGTLDSCCQGDAPPVPLHGSLPVYDLNITVLPVNNQPPSISIGEVFVVDEGSSGCLCGGVLGASDLDTAPEGLVFLVETAPQHGFLENTLPSPGFEKSNAGLSVVSFSLLHLNSGYINYVQSQHQGVEPTVDQFIVMEGGMKDLSPDLLDAVDLDIPSDTLTFSVLVPPTHGILLNGIYGLQMNRYKEMDSKLLQQSLPVQSFTLQELRQGMKIIYMQDDTETLKDAFTMQLTDGRHKVQGTAHVRILPVNDEKPRLLKNAGLEVEAMDKRVISSLVLEAEDRDTPTNKLYFVLNAGPKFGQLQLKTELGWHILGPGQNFTQEDVEMNRLWYLHTTLQGLKGHDSFRFYLSDTDNETPSQSFFISLRTIQKERGFPSCCAGFASWVNMAAEAALALLAPCSMILEERRKRAESSCSPSLLAPPCPVCFSQGTVKTNGQKIPLISCDIVLIAKPVSLMEGERVILTTDILLATDSGGSAEELVYTVSIPPSHGVLHAVQHPGMPLHTFSQLDVAAHRVCYTHDNSRLAQLDSFRGGAPDWDPWAQLPSKYGTMAEPDVFGSLAERGDLRFGFFAWWLLLLAMAGEPTVVISFVISNGVTSKSSSLHFSIEHGDRIPPTLSSNKGLQLTEGATVPISQDRLELMDPDTAVSNLTYTLTQLPQYGRLLLRGQPLSQPRFTQADINSLDLTYQHQSGPAQIDRFTFLASDGTNRGFLLYGQLREQPVAFTIEGLGERAAQLAQVSEARLQETFLRPGGTPFAVTWLELCCANLSQRAEPIVEHVDKTPPSLVIKRAPSTVENLQEGKQGIYITSRDLQASDPDSPNQELEFTILRSPHFGHLENTLTGKPHLPVKNIMRDLDQRAVRYIIDLDIEVTGDSFEFQVTDPAGNTMLPEVLELKWSRVELSATCFRVCENVGMLPVQVMRSGNSIDPAYVGIQVVEGTAKVGRDFTHSTAALIQFDPGVNVKSWNIYLKDDGLEENHEKFEVVLKAQKNAVLGQRQRATVEIVDPRGGNCDPEELRVEEEVEMAPVLHPPKVHTPHSLAQEMHTPHLQLQRSWEKQPLPGRGDVPNRHSSVGYREGELRDQAYLNPQGRQLRVLGTSGGRVHYSEAEMKSEETTWTFHGMIPMTVEEKKPPNPVPIPQVHTELQITPIWTWTGQAHPEDGGGEAPQGDSPQAAPQLVGQKHKIETVMAGACPPGWVTHRETCYSMSPGTASWSSAQHSCALLTDRYLRTMVLDQWPSTVVFQTQADYEARSTAPGGERAQLCAGKMAAAVVQMSCLYRGMLAVRTSGIRPLIPGVVPITLRAFSMKKESELEDNPFYNKYEEKIKQLRSAKPQEFKARLEKRAEVKREPLGHSKQAEFIKVMEQELQKRDKGADGSRGFTKDKTLGSILNVDMVQNMTGEEVGELWMKYFSTKDTISAVIPFLYALPQKEGYEFYLGQWSGKELHFTSLINVQTMGENAPSQLILYHYPELQEQKGIVLMTAEMDPKFISVHQAQCLANQVQLFYGTQRQETFRLVDLFNHKPADFKHMSVIAELEQSNCDDRREARLILKMATVDYRMGQRDGSDQNFDYMFKLLIIGNSSVGKTSFLFRYADDSFSNSFVSTVGIDFKVKTVYRNDKRVKLQIWDTAGQERYRTITTAYYRGAMGFILMYDICNEESFNAVQDWATQIKTYSWDNAQVILVGNKCDMEDERVVSPEKGKHLADQLGFEYYEASAKENINVRQVFERLVDIICVKMSERVDTEPPMATGTKTTRLTDKPANLPQNCNC